MPNELAALAARHGLDAEKIAFIVGISERTARAWLAGEKHTPEPAIRLVRIVTGEASVEDFIPR